MVVANKGTQMTTNVLCRISVRVLLSSSVSLMRRVTDPNGALYVSYPSRIRWFSARAR